MFLMIAKFSLSALIISFCSWLAGKRPALAGFIIALPISTLIALAFTQLEFKDHEKTVLFAKSILLGVPLSLTFFVPFLLANKLKWPFWSLYISGIILLSIAYCIHKAIMER